MVFVPCPQVSERLLFVLLLVLVATPLPAQEPGPMGFPRSIAARTWTTRDGLPQDDVTALLAARDGTLWVGTFGGLARFDGKRFEVFRLSDHPGLGGLRVMSLYEAEDGEIWIGTARAGVSRYRDGRFTHHGPDATVAGDIRLLLPLSDGRMLIGGDGLCLFEDGAFQPLAPEGWPDQVTVDCAAIDATGTVWIGTHQGLFAWRDGRMEHHVRTRVGALLRQDDGTVLVFPDEGAAFVVGAEDPDPRRVPGLELGPMHDVLQAPDGVVWAASIRSGLFLRPPGAEGFQRPTGEAAGRNSCRVLAHDAEGGLWVGSVGDGLTRLRVGAHALVGDAAYPGDPNVWEIAPHGPMLYIAHSRHHLVCLQPDGQRKVLADSFRHLGGLVADGDGLWLSDDRRLLWMGLDEKPVAVAVLPDRIETLLPGAGGVWIGGEGFLAHYRAGEEPRVFPLPEPLDQRVVFSLAADAAGRVWTAVPGAVIRCDGDRLTLLEEGPIASVGEVRGVAIDPEGSLWIATYGAGLLHYGEAGGASLTYAEALPEDALCAVMPTDDGWLLISGNQGVYAARRDDLRARMSGGRNDLPLHHLAPFEGNGEVAVRAEDGSFWFTTVVGALGVPGLVTPRVLTPPTVRWLGLSEDGAPRHLDEEVHLRPASRNLHLRFGAITFEDPEGVLIRYRTWLEGQEPGPWSRPLRTDQLALGGLQHGVHLVALEASRDGRQFGPAAALLRIVKPPRWFETLWFQALAILSGVAVIALLHHLRTEGVRRQAAARAARKDAALQEGAKFRVLTETATDAILVFETEGEIVFLNSAAAHLLAGDRESLIGTAITDHLPGFAPLEGVDLADLASDDGTARVLYHDRRFVVSLPEGRRPHLDASLATHRTAEGRRCFTAVLRDVSERALLQRARSEFIEKRHHAERLATVGRLAGGVAHDINNVLAALGGSIELLKVQKGAEVPEVDAATGVMLRCVDRAAKLVRQLLAFSGSHDTQPQILDPRAALEGAREMLERLLPGSIVLTLEVEEGLGTVAIDPVQIEQVVINLVVNARDAIGEEDGHIRLEGRTLGEDRVLIAVEDDGPGVAPEHRPFIFDPFFTTKKGTGGTGLGLATVSGIVQRAGGRVRCVAPEGAGARFEIELPVTRGVLGSKLPTDCRAPIVHEATVLLIDADQELSRAMASLLEARGLRVLVADEVTVARRIAQELKSELDVLLVDPAVPGAYALAQTLAAQAKPPGVLFASTRSLAELRRQGLRVPAGAHLKKPFTLSEVLQAIRAPHERLELHLEEA